MSKRGWKHELCVAILPHGNESDSIPDHHENHYARSTLQGCVGLQTLPSETATEFTQSIEQAAKQPTDHFHSIILVGSSGMEKLVNK